MARSGRGKPRRPEIVEDGRGERRTDGGGRARFRRLEGSRHGAVSEVGEELEAEGMEASVWAQAALFAGYRKGTAAA